LQQLDELVDARDREVDLEEMHSSLAGGNHVQRRSLAWRCMFVNVLLPFGGMNHHHDISKNFGLNIQELDLNCCLPSYNSTSTYVVGFFML
jgi:hypothetical protein